MTGRVLEAYTWYVIDSDDCTSLQEDEENNFTCVDQTKIKAVLLLPLQKLEVGHRVDIPKGAQAIFFRRRSIEINPLSGQESNRPTTHCIGWKNEESAVYLFVFQDGSTLLSNDLQAI